MVPVPTKGKIIQSLQFQFVLKANSFFENGNESCIGIQAQIV